MASYSSLIFFDIVIFVASLLIHSSFGVSNETLTYILSKTQHPKESVAILQSDPRTASADYAKLSLISIDITRKQTDQNLKTFIELSHNATTAESKSQFDSCIRLYRQMELRIEAANLLSTKRDYKNNVDLFQANELALRCEIGITVNSMVISELHESVLLKLDISITVNNYISDNITISPV